MHRLAIPALFAVAACVPTAPPKPNPPPRPPPPPAITHSAAPTPTGPPIAALHPLSETHFGVTVSDPYRWMEQPDSPMFDALLAEETEHSERVLAALPLRAPLLARIAQLDNIGVSVVDMSIWKGSYFYQESEPGRDGRSLYVRRAQRGAERRIVDAETLGTEGARPTIDFFMPSVDGRFIAFGERSARDTDCILQLVETGSRALLAQPIDRVPSPSIAWQTDGRSFFYLRSPPPTAAAPKASGGANARVYMHEIGRNPDEDPAVFGPGVVPTFTIDADDRCEVIAPPGSRNIFVSVRRAGRRELDLYAAPTDAIPQDLGAWRKIVDADAQQAIAFDVHGGDLYLLTHKNAPHFQVIRTDVAHPFALRSSTMVAESDAVITSFGVARDALYLSTLDHGIGRIRRISFKAGRGEHLPLPFDGSITRMFVQPFAPGVIFQLGSPTVPPRFYAYDPKAKAVIDPRLIPTLPIDLSGLTTTVRVAKSADGTQIPLEIVHAKDLRRNGSHPTWMHVNGAHGALLDTTLRPTMLTWLERGGVVAYCHARGGGEQGQGWHEAGARHNKPRSIEDLVACAETMSDGTLSAKGRIAADGAGVGGLLVLGAILQKPELFGAALVRDSFPNTTRLGEVAAGAQEADELGTGATEAGWKALWAVDAYHGVKDQSSYPALLFTTRRGDPRAPAWQSTKMVARLRAASGNPKNVLLRLQEGAGKAFAEAQLADEMAFLFNALQ